MNNNINNNFFGFLLFLIEKEYLKKIDSPCEGCLMIIYDQDPANLNSCIIISSENDIPKTVGQHKFYEPLPAEKIKEHFAEYLTLLRIGQ
jgi:hypothetical protein